MVAEGPEQTWHGPAPHSQTLWSVPCRPLQPHSPPVPPFEPFGTALSLLFLWAFWNCFYFLRRAKRLPDSGPAPSEALLPLSAWPSLLPLLTQTSADWRMLSIAACKTSAWSLSRRLQGPWVWGFPGEDTDLGFATFLDAMSTSCFLQ